MDVFYIATFFVALISSILSGVSGGGGGFIMAPYWLISGLTPAQGAATGAFMATGMSISSVAAFRKTGHFPKDKKLLILLAAVTFFASILGALIVPKIDIQAFKYMLAMLTIFALPLLFLKPTTKYRFIEQKKLGLAIAIVLLIVGSIITSSAFTILFALTLTTFFSMPILQTTAFRRLLGIVQSAVLFILFAAQGYFVWQHAIAGFLGGSIGSYIGTKFSVKKGERFAKYALAAVSFISAVALLL